jgi:putative FmdB family regulatory protein
MVSSIVTRTYKCGRCGEFEKLESIKDEPLKECPECKQELKRRFHLTDVLFCEVNRNRFNGIRPQKENPILIK